jgi:uncharacterized protein
VREFLSVLYERAIAHPRIVVREFRDAYQKITGGIASLQVLSPFGIVSVDWRGGFSTFSPEVLGLSDPRFGDFVFGSVLDGPVLRALDNPKFAAVHEEIVRGVEMCRAQCAHFEFCGGGYPSNKLAENGTFASSETQDCSIRVKTIVDLIAERYNSELEDGTFWRRHDGRRI